MSYNKIPAVAISVVLLGVALYPGRACAENSVLSLLWSGVISPDNFGTRSTTVRSGYDYEKSSSQKFEWRADEDSPLVVYDPMQLKEVNEKTIIGVWTHGGRNYKTPDAPRVPWADAYEALATLDRNRDYSVSGRELHAVSLWFDRNRDAQAQPEEVVPASRAGLAEISVRGQPLVLPDGSKYYRQGYRRFKDAGQIVAGSSISWSLRPIDGKPTRAATAVAGAATLSAVQTALPTQAPPTPTMTPLPTVIFTPTMIPTGALPTSAPTHISVASPEPDHSSNASSAHATDATSSARRDGRDSPFNGYWRLTKDFDAEPDSGLIHLEVLEDGSLRGTSVSSFEAHAQDDSIVTARVVAVFGEVVGERGEEIAFRMVERDQNQSTSCVAAIVERNGKTFLKGSTISQIVDAEGVQRKVSNEWLAVRSAEWQ